MKCLPRSNIYNCNSYLILEREDWSCISLVYHSKHFAGKVNASAKWEHLLVLAEEAAAPRCSSDCRCPQSRAWGGQRNGRAWARAGHRVYKELLCHRKMHTLCNLKTNVVNHFTWNKMWKGLCWWVCNFFFFTLAFQADLKAISETIDIGDRTPTCYTNWIEIGGKQPLLFLLNWQLGHGTPTCSTGYWFWLGCLQFCFILEEETGKFRWGDYAQ